MFSLRNQSAGSRLRSISGSGILLTSLLTVNLVWGSQVHAGVNRDGTLLVHADPLVEYSIDDAPYVGRSAIKECFEATTRLSGQTAVVWWVTAAFDRGYPPRVMYVSFGIEYDSSALAIVDYGPSSDYEAATEAWPESGQGTTTTWGEVESTDLIEVYWFAGYTYNGSNPSFELIPHPDLGSHFGDDSIPQELDEITALGKLGFNDAAGRLACPPPEGACCDCTCKIMTAEECEEELGEYQGDDTVCDPSPCECPPDVGACCLESGDCEQLTEEQCSEFGIRYEGDHSDCEDPEVCFFSPPTLETSWGNLKARYRIAG